MPEYGLDPAMRKTLSRWVDGDPTDLDRALAVLWLAEDKGAFLAARQQVLDLIPRVEIVERLGHPTVCKVWRGERLVFHGRDFSPDLRIPPLPEHIDRASYDLGRHERSMEIEADRMVAEAEAEDDLEDDPCQFHIDLGWVSCPLPRGHEGEHSPGSRTAQAALDRIEAWCTAQDGISKGESPTTHAVRAARRGES